MALDKDTLDKWKLEASISADNRTVLLIEEIERLHKLGDELFQWIDERGAHTINCKLQGYPRCTCGLFKCLALDIGCIHEWESKKSGEPEESIVVCKQCGREKE
jgi:hypothetical protein